MLMTAGRCRVWLRPPTATLLRRNAHTTQQPPQIVSADVNPYSQQPLKTILRSSLVLGVCASEKFVKASPKMYQLSRKVLGDKITRAVLKKTFFGHFCGGETREEVLPTILELRNNKVGTILDYAAEGDSTDNPQHTLSSYTEARCDQTLATCLECIDTAAEYPNGFAAIKLTGLGNPDLLKRIAAVMRHIRDTFGELFDTSNSPSGASGKSAGVYSQYLTDDKFSNEHHLNRAMNFQEFCDGIERMGLSKYMDLEQLRHVFQDMDSMRDGRVDFLEWIEFVQPTHKAYRPFFIEKLENASTEDQLDRPLEQHEVEQLDRLVQRLYKLADHAKAKKVRLLVDAEHTYFQPAIDHLVLHLQRLYNTEFPTIFNTYQTYLRDSYSRISIDVERAKKEKFYFAAKVVRGAYMSQERLRAKTLGEGDPIHFNKELTDKNFNLSVELVLKRSPQFSLMVATHNEGSIQKTVELMHQTGQPKDGNIFFGQLQGMCDRITFSLAHHGYQVLKYVPFGPVFDVVPYLLRRVEENSGMMSTGGAERKVLQQELIRRLLRKQK
eukprot:c14136_g1_i1.p1 GENE.c14136_g1_i1~~c14136_g1_i1.p1  ORF type:complete len:565 (+),score=124.18 c14136_g1_i1:37-1695(+)